MATITIRGGTEIFCKDWGSKGAQPLFFHHSWPLKLQGRIGGASWDQ